MHLVCSKPGSLVSLVSSNKPTVALLFTYHGYFYLEMLINELFYFQMVQAIQVLRFHLLELEKVSYFKFLNEKPNYMKLSVVIIFTRLSLSALSDGSSLRCESNIKSILHSNSYLN